MQLPSPKRETDLELCRILDSIVSWEGDLPLACFACLLQLFSFWQVLSVRRHNGCWKLEAYSVLINLVPTAAIKNTIPCILFAGDLFFFNLCLQKLLECSFLFLLFWNFTMICLVMDLFLIYCAEHPEGSLLWKLLLFKTENHFHIIILILTLLPFFPLPFSWNLNCLNQV